MYNVAHGRTLILYQWVSNVFLMFYMWYSIKYITVDSKQSFHHMIDYNLTYTDILITASTCKRHFQAYYIDQSEIMYMYAILIKKITSYQGLTEIMITKRL